MKTNHRLGRFAKIAIGFAWSLQALWLLLVVRGLYHAVGLSRTAEDWSHGSPPSELFGVPTKLPAELTAGAAFRPLDAFGAGWPMRSLALVLAIVSILALWRGRAQLLRSRRAAWIALGGLSALALIGVFWLGGMAAYGETVSGYGWRPSAMMALHNAISWLRLVGLAVVLALPIGAVHASRRDIDGTGAIVYRLALWNWIALLTITVWIAIAVGLFFSPTA